MTAVHSSVHPKSTKLPWGTIIKPVFGLGYQKMNEYEIDQTVNRLSQLPERKSRPYSRVGKTMDKDEINEMLERLTKVKKEKIPDHDRRFMTSPYREMGVVNSYAWKGYN
ncbi:uncharacterized protein LOC123566507 [Mercenaria mercenaria]|uniref:uncharacterized protein LOC123566507 n=1 Tax=Mercenaria mercenaria TaxID=6596 RepID=UPI00234F6648|nr:uncharacterized protein LOC123566507 [Mercenaria mercenaria]XP_045216606.2 uncharacterized protein LOC123566507 [Mercenaria mercenaria]